MKTHIASFLKQTIPAFALLVMLSGISQGQIVYQISEPSEGNQGTFTVSLEHSVAQPGLNCRFLSIATFTMEIRGEGFEVSNVVGFDPDDDIFQFELFGSQVVTWSRMFAGPTDDFEISGPLISFDVNFVPGVENANYTIGDKGFSGVFDVECFDDNGLPVDSFQGEYFDNFGGRTFTPFLLGDVNRDGVVDLLDVGPFVDLITAGEFQVEADINMDGLVTLLDVGPFVDLLSGG